MTFFRAFQRDRKGVTSIEFGLIAAACALGMAVAAVQVTSTLESNFNVVNGTLDLTSYSGFGGESGSGSGDSGSSGGGDSGSGDSGNSGNGNNGNNGNHGNGNNGNHGNGNNGNGNNGNGNGNGGGNDPWWKWW